MAFAREMLKFFEFLYIIMDNQQIHLRFPIENS